MSIALEKCFYALKCLIAIVLLCNQFQVTYDGNKRSAIVSCETFIEMNDATLDAHDASLYQAILFLAESKFTEREFAEWLRANISINTRGQVQEPRAEYKVSPKTRGKKTKA